MAVALVLHVTDEALTDFLSVYNPIATAIRDRFSWSPLPIFTFEVWISRLAVAIVVVFLLTPLAFRGARWLAFLAVPFAVLMMANGLGHIGGSFYMLRFMPGVTSSPVLIVASAALLICAVRVLRSEKTPLSRKRERGGG
jgi:hypothetical protein